VRREKAATNWLPSQAGGFQPVVRMYEPGLSVLDRTYEFPAITRA